MYDSIQFGLVIVVESTCFPSHDGGTVWSAWDIQTKLENMITPAQYLSLKLCSVEGNPSVSSKLTYHGILVP
jgi:hypothetical protein